MNPSAPTPNRRSHRARTNSGSSGRRSSTSTSTRKSLPAPWCLVRWSERRLWRRLTHRAGDQSPTPAPSRANLPEAGGHAQPPGRHPAPPTRYGDHGGTRPSAAGRRTGCGGRPGRRRRPGACPARDGRGARGSRAPGGPSSTGRRARRPGTGPRPGSRDPSAVRAARRCAGRGSAGSRADPDQRHRGRRVALEPRAEDGEGAARPHGDLEGPDQASAVGGVDAAGGHRVEAGQPVVEAASAGPAVLPSGPAASSPRSSWTPRRDSAREGQVVDQRPQVEAGPPDQQGPVTAGGDAVEGEAPGGLELLDGELLRRVDQVDQVIAVTLPAPGSVWPSRCPCPGRRPSSRPRPARGADGRRPKAPATRRATADLPDAVGPRRATIGGRRATVAIGRSSGGGHRDAHPMGGPSRYPEQFAGEVVPTGAGDHGRRRTNRWPPGIRPPAGSGPACSGWSAR